MGSGSRPLGFESWLCLPFNLVTPNKLLFLSFLIQKMEMLVVSTSVVLKITLIDI